MNLMFGILGSGDPLSHVVQHVLYRSADGGFVFTNHMLMLLVGLMDWR